MRAQEQCPRPRGPRATSASNLSSTSSYISFLPSALAILSPVVIPAPPVDGSDSLPSYIHVPGGAC